MTTASLLSRAVGWRRSARFLAPLLTVFLASVLVLPASAGKSTWKVEPLDSPRGFGSLTHDSLAADRDGGLHLAYGGRHLYYAYRQNAGSAWRFETADGAPNVGSGAAIALDDVGRPHISYCDGISGGVRYAHRDGFGWQVEIVYAPPKPQGSAALGDSAPDTEALEATPAGPGDPNCSTSVAIGRDGRAHIAFHPTPPAHGLEYAYRDATGWHVSVRDDGAFAGSEPSVALDSHDYPRISYYGGYPYYDLRYTWQDASGWHTIELSHGGDAGLYSSLAVDGEDRAHIAYYEAYTGDLMYIRQTADQWTPEPVDTTGDAGQFVSLALDGNDQPYISYYQAAPAPEVRIAHRDGVGWHVDTVMGVGSMTITGDTAVALDRTGAPRVAFIDPALRMLWLMAPAGAYGWQGEAVDRGGTAGDNSSLILDAEGYPHISYYAGYLRGGPFFGHLKHAWQDAAGWHDETVDAGGDPGQGSSLAIDKGGGLHVSYLVKDPAGRLMYARNEADNWHPETVAQGAWSAGPTSLNLDVGGNPHIGYVDGNTLKHAYRDALGWHVESVDPGTLAWCQTPQASLALNETGHPHIAYSLCSPPELRHAWQDETGWHVEVVDADGEMGGYNSLALGTDGRPRIAYYVGYPYHHLRYAWRDAVGWHREVACSGGDVGLYPSLVLDGADQPHISFLGYLPDRYTMSLGIAQRVGMGWSIMVGLHTGIDTRPGTSLALDEAGLPIVSFSCDGGLCLGRFVPWGKRFLPTVAKLSEDSRRPSASD